MIREITWTHKHQFEIIQVLQRSPTLVSIEGFFQFKFKYVVHCVFNEVGSGLFDSFSMQTQVFHRVKKSTGAQVLFLDECQHAKLFCTGFN